jgi:uncharacterized protein
LAAADLDQVEAMVQLNVVAATRLAGAAAASFASRGRGTLINISSVLALAPERFPGAYSATKAFVLNLTLSLSHELAGSGVQVQAVLPGATRTEIWKRAGIDPSALDPDILMDVDEMVDAALAGLDKGELVTIPALEDWAKWEHFTASRLALGPHLSRNHAAARYSARSGSSGHGATAPATVG